ncbi:MAG: fimbrillin family protein [Prevotella sp.]|nr:fimbrillin family protein [Prevotella sp.]
MKDILSVVAAAAVIASMASCSSETDFEGKTSQEDQVSTPVNFGSYLAQSKMTRATEGTPASESEMTIDLLKSKGFGVIAYYTESSKYEDVNTSKVPNFMYNTMVSGDGWTYSPIKYWPNGGQSQGSAPVEGTQYVSFFAYAPYKSVAASTGAADDKAATGITALSSNATNGDPTVSYTLGATGADSDLLWGTAGTNGSTTSGTEAQDGTTLTGGKAAVNANLSKMKVGGKVKFNFKHALAKFGGTGATGSDSKTSGLMVVADIDNGSETTGGTLNADETKITVKSIKIESVKAGTAGKMATDASIPTSGTLNLATGEWKTTDANNGKIDYEINSKAVTTTAPAGATTQTMNTDIAEPQSVNSWDDLKNVTGVTTTAKSVYTETTPLLIIPDGNAHTFRITIDYIVRTKDDALSKGYTEVKQSFYKDLTLSKVSLNAKYNLLIHLGLTSVKFDATVSDWTNTVNGGTTEGSSTDTDPMVIYMPENVASAK